MQISRRDLFLSGTAAAIVTGATVAPLAIKSAATKAALRGEPNDESLLALRRQWISWRDYCQNYPDEADEARDPLYDRLTEIEKLIFAAPAQTAQGVMVKMELWQHHYLCWDQLRSPSWWQGDVDVMCLDEMGIAMVLRDLERLGGGLPS